jgi:integrase
MRQAWVDQGLARKSINHNLRRVVRVFKWGVENEMVAPTTWQALEAVEGLKKGRTTAPEPVPIFPVPEMVVDATVLHLSPVVRSMIQVQMLTGARPGEVCKMRPMDIDRSEDVWVYRPSSHKTEHHGRSRQIFMGLEAQKVILPYLLRAADANCFSAAESREWFREQADLNRKTKRSCGNARGRKHDRRRGPKTRQPRGYFDSQTYAQAIARACRKAWPAPKEIRYDKAAVQRWDDDHRWAPNHLRHNWATRVRAKYGLEAAQVGLGHATADVTQIYAERDTKLAKQVAREIG